MAKAAKTPHTSRKYFTVNEVAAILSVAPKTVYRWIEDGSLVPTRLPGNTIRINEEFLNNWLDKRTISEKTIHALFEKKKAGAEKKTLDKKMVNEFAERLMEKWNNKNKAAAIEEYIKTHGIPPPADFF